MKAIRLALICLIGIPLVHYTIKFQYEQFVDDALIWFFLLIAGTIVLIWTLIADIRNYRFTREIGALFPALLGIAFLITILAIEYRVQARFNKATWVRADYDGDINGVSIDFKIDGSYVLNNHVIGSSDYSYGNYTIDGNRITLDKTFGRIITTPYFEIRQRSDRHGSKWLYLLSDDGAVLDSVSFKVTIDNR
ncbi:hypothetical protein [Parapedobacter sp. 2B3]|uniref:hypothetical protein n=1 Tax=Parapedobacter sp. 2B3 TaxID=3342381 RepID=UPI0035B69253